MIYHPKRGAFKCPALVVFFVLQGDIIARSYPFPFLSNSSAVAVKNTSPLLLRAVSTESWTTPMIKPTATACMATSLPIPKNEHAIGISSNDPPATPEAPQAPKVVITPNKRAEANVTSTPTVCATARAKTVIDLLHSLGVDDQDIRFDNFGG